MVTITTKRLGSYAKVYVGDVCNLDVVVSSSSAAVLSFFAIHHLDPENVLKALKEWNRVLHPGDQLEFENLYCD
jgi:ubiquinone/menaquinone biosynthesis C-methylase UbiE